MKNLLCTTYKLGIKKNQAYYPHQDFYILICSTLFNTNVYLFVSFRALNIVTSKDKEMFKPKILMMVKKNSLFLSGSLAVWRISRNQVRPVWAENVKNYSARKLELLCTHNRCTGHLGDIWKIIGKAIFFCNKFF